MKCKYDVFISYSRDDYEGVDKIIIPGNPISKIQEVFEKNGISYWFDKEGIYSSQKFIKVISDAIANSYILVFVSSVHSNDSEYTALEINDAFRKKKKIISVKIDECEFNDDFGIILNSVDYIDYFVNPDVALEELIRSINKIKEKIALEEIEEEEAKKIDDNKKKIKKQTQIYCTWKSRIDSTIRELIKLNESIGNTTKECPVCGSECSIGDVFCEYCGWNFSSIYALSEDCNQTENEELLALCKVNYELIINGSADNEKTKRLENECEELREKIHNFESRQKDWDSEKKELSAKIQTLEESQKVFDGEKNALTARIHELEKQQKDWSSKEENFLNEIIQLKSEHTKSELGKVKDNSVISKISHFINKSFNELDIEEGKENRNDLDFNVKGVRFKMVKVEGGRFMMGATREQGSDARSDEKPAHKVKLSDYYIGQVPVTQELWQAVIGKNPSNFKGEKNPVENVSWIDCNEFIEKLNKQTMNKRPAGMEFRLPSEAEWEFAARGGSNRNGVNYKYSGSNNLGEVAWYNRNSSNKTHPVGRMKPNQLGVYDMSGNVWEWCRDGMRKYDSCNQINPYCLNYSNYHRRVLRGGGWYFDASRCRVSSRREDDTSNSFSHYGLRLCLVKVL